MVYLLSRYRHVYPKYRIVSILKQKLPNYERFNKSNSAKKYNWSEVINLGWKISYIIIIFTSFHAIFLALQAHLSSERNEGRAIRFMHEASFCGSEFLSLSLSFFCDNGLFLTRGASQNLRKRCHGKKRGGGSRYHPAAMGYVFRAWREASFSKTASRCDEEEKIKIGFPLRGLAGSIEEWMVWCGQFVMALPPSSSRGKSVASCWWIILDIFLLSSRVLYQTFPLNFLSL